MDSNPCLYLTSRGVKTSAVNCSWPREQTIVKRWKKTQLPVAKEDGVYTYAHIDIVEFTVNDAGWLTGRAVHPVEGMTYKEFAYCAYTLAASTDRLEYLIQEPDVY